MKIYDKNGYLKNIEFDRFYESKNGMYYLIYKIYDHKFNQYETDIMVNEDENLNIVLQYYGYILKEGDKNGLQNV